MDPIGKSPIAAPVLILGKIAMGTCWLFFLVKPFGIDTMLYESPWTRACGIVLLMAGVTLAGLSFFFLGKSLSVGLPEEKTELKTGGVYRITRNPIYLGAFLMCGGSCLYSIHPVNVLLLAVTVGIHHRIVKKEEEFLEERFGQQWLDYKHRVPRYVGQIETAPNEGPNQV